MAIKIEDPIALLDNLRALTGEIDWVEFKTNNDNSIAIGKYVSALSNAAILREKSEAYLVWGIEDETHNVVGTTVNLNAKKEGNEPFLLWLSKMLDPRISLLVETVLYHGESVEILCITPSYERPVRFQNQAYVRIGSAQQKLAEYPDLERSIWQITSRFSFESSIIQPNATIDDLNEHYDFTKLLELLEITANSTDAKLDRLVGEGLIQKNLQGRFDVLALMAIACAKDLDRFPALSMKGMRLLEFEGNDKDTAREDLAGTKGYAVVFSVLMKRLMGLLSEGEEFIDGIRTSIYEIPEVAIREFVANALVHQDFTRQGERPTFEVYADRVKIINPGIPLIEADRFIDSPSKSRNPEFSNLMRKAGLCELRGSGVDRALRAIEAAALPPPSIQIVEGSTVVTTFKQKPFAKWTSDERILACYQHACLQFEENDPMSNASLRERFGLPQRQYPQVSMVIKDALDRGRIAPLSEDQSNRYARYVPYWAG